MHVDCVMFISFFFSSHLSIFVSVCLSRFAFCIFVLTLDLSFSRACLVATLVQRALALLHSIYLFLTRPIKGTAKAYTTRNNEYIYRDIHSLSTILLYDTLNASASVYAYI